MAVVAMTRELATRGEDVAAGLAERLGLTMVQHEIVEHDLARLAALSDREVHRFMQGETSLIDRWKINPAHMSGYAAHEILELAAKGNVLIRGWGASYLLRSVPHVVCVRISAPMEFRKAVLIERLGLKDVAAACRQIERDDAVHSAVMQKMFGASWRAPWFYAIALNTARVPVADCVEHIVNLVESPVFAETPQSRIALMDDLVAVRVRHVLEGRFGAVGKASGFDASVSNGKVTLTGGCSDDHLIVEAVRMAYNVEGVTAVESRISHVAFLPHAGSRSPGME